MINLEILCLKYYAIQKKLPTICLLKCLVIIQKKKEVMLSQGSKFKVLTFMIFTMRQNRTTTYAEKYTLDM